MLKYGKFEIKKVITGDLGGKGKCSEFTDEICARVKNMPWWKIETKLYTEFLD